MSHLLLSLPILMARSTSVNRLSTFCGCRRLYMLSAACLPACLPSCWASELCTGWATSTPPRSDNHRRGVMRHFGHFGRMRSQSSRHPVSARVSSESGPFLPPLPLSQQLLLRIISSVAGGGGNVANTRHTAARGRSPSIFCRCHPIFAF